MVDAEIIKQRIKFKRGDKVEVNALEEWVPATFRRVLKSGAIEVNVAGLGICTTTVYSVRGGQS